MTDPTPTGARRSRRRRPWLIVPVLLVSLGATEIALRVLDPARKGAGPMPAGETQQAFLHVRSNVPGLAYELAPSRDVSYQGVRVRTNSLGMRGGETTVAKPSGELRIAALGDSITFGWAVEYEEAWPAVLERLLRAKSACSVLDFGVSGYSAYDEAVVLREKALPLDPDVIVIGYFLNDPEADAISPLHAWFRDASWWERSRLWKLCAQWQRKRERQSLGGGDFYRWMHNQNGAPWKSAVAAFESIAAAAREHGDPVLVAIFPTWVGYDDLARYPYADLHAQVAREVERQGMRALDLMPVYQSSGASFAELKVDDEHPSARGHEIAARAILARLEELKWLRPKR